MLGDPVELLFGLSDLIRKLDRDELLTFKTHVRYECKVDRSTLLFQQFLLILVLCICGTLQHQGVCNVFAALGLEFSELVLEPLLAQLDQVFLGIGIVTLELF